MRARLVDARTLLGFLKRRPPLRVYAHLLSEPFLSALLASPPELVVLDDRPENRDSAGRLLEAGVPVYRLPGLHAKMVIGEDYLVVGSANLTARSLRNYEAVLILDGVDPLRVEGVAKILDQVHRRMEHWW